MIELIKTYFLKAIKQKFKFVYDFSIKSPYMV